MLVLENINLFHHSARTLLTDGQTDRQDYYGTTALCTKVHRTVKKGKAETEGDGAKLDYSASSTGICTRPDF